MLNTVKVEGSQPKTTAPETRITIAISVLNTKEDSTTDTMVTRQRHDSFVAETVTANVELRPKALGTMGLRTLLVHPIMAPPVRLASAHLV